MRGDTAGPANGGGNGGHGNGHGNGGNGGNGGSTPTNGGATATPAKPMNPATTKAAAEAFTDEPPTVPAQLVGLDLGPACGQCGGMMQRTGSCYTCSSCGNNTGCG
jgi:ribonucleoside-diphosphate reductase alpha chain